MTHYDHLIIGGGMAADAAAHGIREQDEDAAFQRMDRHVAGYRDIATGAAPMPSAAKKVEAGTS